MSGQRRLVEPGRAQQHKLVSVELLRAYRETLTLMQPDVEHRFRVDVTDLVPEAAAHRVVALLQGVAGR